MNVSPESSRCSFPVANLDLRQTMALQALGRFDPTSGFTANGFRKVFGFDGHNLRVQLTTRDDELEVVVEGPRSDELLQAWRPHLLSSIADHRSTLRHAALARLHHRFPGLRIFRVPWLFDVACSCVLQQRVRFEEACAAWRRIAERHGHRDASGLSFPAAQKLARMGSAQLEALGVDARRARTLIGLAREEVFAKFLRLDAEAERTRKRLASIQGIGPWTVEMFMGFGRGDLDALPLGDVHLPRMVGAAFGERTAMNDARMVELLEPFRGERFRVVRWIYADVFHARDD